MGKIKSIRSSFYNYDFYYNTGYFYRWGKNYNDDPEYSPVGPEILDCEISTICDGGCKFCYKSNTTSGKNMSFETFKLIFHKVNKNLTQIAFGIGSIGANKDLWKIMEYCREHSVVPNITINGNNLTDKYANKLVELCGAVSISRYNTDTCYNAVKKLTDRDLRQVNIHQLICEETLNECYKVIDDYHNDLRLEKLNAVVFLMMKPKGKRNKYHQLTDIKEYKKLIDYAFKNDVPFGMDSCSANVFLKSIKDRDNYKQLEMMVEPCESDCFSSYINVDGKYFHCSFTEGEDGWDGIDVLKCEDFIKDVWYSPEVRKFRDKLLTSAKKERCRTCPLYNLTME